MKSVGALGGLEAFLKCTGDFDGLDAFLRNTALGLDAFLGIIGALGGLDDFLRSTGALGTFEVLAYILKFTGFIYFFDSFLTTTDVVGFYTILKSTGPVCIPDSL